MGYNGNRDQGEEAELRINLALGGLLKKKIITGFMRAKKHGELDINGIDFLIKLSHGFAMLLQVKSSKSSLKRHHSRYPNIPCVVVEPRHTDIRSIERRIKAIIKKKFSNFKMILS